MNAYKGALLADRTRPDWFNEIDVDRLDMSFADACILGQLFNDYWNVAEEMENRRGVVHMRKFMERNGFNYYGEGDYFDVMKKLTEEWKHEILLRRGE